MEAYVGMDVHCKESVYVIQDGTGRVIGEGQVPTSWMGMLEFQERHGVAPGTKVALETGSVSFYVARLLMRLGLVPVVVDAHEVRLKAHRPNQKSDRRDAFELCEGLRRDIYRVIVHIPPPEVQQLREALARRRHFVQICTREVVSAKHLLRAEGLVELTGHLRSEPAWSRLVERLDFAPDLQVLIDCHRTAWLCAQAQVRRIEQHIGQIRTAHTASVTALQAIPGVGPIVAQTVVAAVSDPERFPTAKHVASFAGLVPSTHQSGERNHQGRITKRGSPELRAMLCEAAHHASRPEHPLNPYFAKLCARRGYRMAVVAVAHRLLRIMWAMMRSGTDFDVGRLGVEAGPFEVTVKRPYRLKKTRALAKAGPGRTAKTRSSTGTMIVPRAAV